MLLSIVLLSMLNGFVAGTVTFSGSFEVRAASSNRWRIQSSPISGFLEVGVVSWRIHSLPIASSAAERSPVTVLWKGALLKCTFSVIFVYWVFSMGSIVSEISLTVSSSGLAISLAASSGSFTLPATEEGSVLRFSRYPFGCFSQLHHLYFILVIDILSASSLLSSLRISSRNLSIFLHCCQTSSKSSIFFLRKEQESSRLITSINLLCTRVIVRGKVLSI